MATIKDIAKHAGVSVTTVSRAFNNRGYISQATRDKIDQACKDLNYTPNELARALFRNKSNIIGVMIPRLDSYFFSEFIQIIEHQLYKAGYKMMICATNGDAEKEQSYFNMFQANKVDGVIIASYLSDGYFDYSALKMPAVAFDRLLSDQIPCIGSDHYALGQLATTTLINKGCKYLLHISGDTQISSPAHEKTLAFEATCKKQNITYAIYEKNMVVEPIYHQPSTSKKGQTLEELFDTIIRDHPQVDGLLLSDDDAAHFIQYANRHDIRVPEDIQLIGYDNLRIGCLTTPNLTTVAQNLNAISTQLVTVLTDLINKKTERKDQYKLPVALIERDSTL